MSNQITASVRKTLTIGGESYADNQTPTGDQEINNKLEVIAAQPAVLTTRTDANTGSLTMTNTGSHGITTGMRVDIYWFLAGVKKVQYGVTVGTVSGAVVPIDLGLGDNLPAAASQVLVAPVTNIPVSFNTDKTKAYGLHTTKSGLFLVCKADETIQLNSPLDANEADVWSTFDAATNPMGSNKDITKVYMSHMDDTGTAIMKFGILNDF